MYTDKIIQRIEDLKTTTESHICGIQKCLVPMYVDLNAAIGKPYAFNPSGNIAQYNIGEEICFVDGNAYFAIRVNNLPFIEEKTSLRNPRYFKESLTRLISNGEIKPILIFYDNRFIPWSKINIVKNKDDSWMLIDGITDITKPIHCIAFPFNIEYSETGFHKDANSLIFDENGELNRDGNYVINITNKNVIFRLNRVETGRSILRCEIDTPEEYLCSSFNCFIFKDNVLYPEAKVTFEGYNILTVDDGMTEPDDNLTYAFFYNRNTCLAEGNPMRVSDRNIVKNAIFSSDDNINRLGQHLDFDFNPNTDYAHNIASALSDIMRHNGALLNKIYAENSKIETLTYTGASFKKIIKRGKVTFLTKRIISEGVSCYHNPTTPIKYDDNHLIEVRPMIFVNGILSDMMRTMTIVGNYCTFDTDGAFDDDDNIEILFFKDINNEIIKSHTVIDDKNYIPYACSEDVLEKIEVDNLMAFCPVAPSDSVFNMVSIDENDRVQYRLPITTIEDEDNGKINLKIDGYDFSGDRDITFAAKNQFHHFGVTVMSEYLINIMLTPEFNYCVDKEHYMVFVNGRKIEQNHFKIVSADPRYPFDDVSIYLFFELEKNDRLDVFYLPIVCEEHIIKPETPTNGNIYLDKYLFDYSLSTDLHLFFLNGKKVSQPDIIDVDSSRVCINNDTETVSNLCILQHIPVEEVLRQLFHDESLRSVWEDVLSSIDQDTLKDLLGINKNIEISNKEEDIYEWQLTAKEVIFEIARDYWLSERVYSGDVFKYNYKSLELTQEDFINEEVAKIEDFTKRDPTGKIVANLQHGHVDFLRTKNGEPATQEDIAAWEALHPKK